MTITAVGATQQDGQVESGGVFVDGLTVTMGSLAIGDYLILGSIEIDTDTGFPFIDAVAGGGVPSSGPGSWQQIVDSGYWDDSIHSDARHCEIWMGQITSLGSGVVNVAYRNALFMQVDVARIACQQFHSSEGALIAASHHGSNSNIGGNLANGNYDALTGLGLYFACGLFNTPVSGSDAGFTYINGIGGGTGGSVVWDASAAGTSSPAWSQSGGSSVWGTCAALLEEQASQQMIVMSP